MIFFSEDKFFWDVIRIEISAVTLPPLILDNFASTVVYETLPLGTLIADKCGLDLCWRSVGDDWIHFCWKLIYNKTWELHLTTVLDVCYTLCSI